MYVCECSLRTERPLGCSVPDFGHFVVIPNYISRKHTIVINLSLQKRENTQINSSNVTTNTGPVMSIYISNHLVVFVTTGFQLLQTCNPQNRTAKRKLRSQNAIWLIYWFGKFNDDCTYDRGKSRSHSCEILQTAEAVEFLVHFLAIQTNGTVYGTLAASKSISIHIPKLQK